MPKFFVTVAMMFLALPLSRAQPAASQFDTAGIVFTTISGPVHNAVVYAPKPPYPTAALQQHFTGRGIYKMDLDNGTPYDVRIVQSAGHKILDDAAVETLRTWRFQPHRLTWATIPIDFRLTKQSQRAKARD